MLSIGAGVLIVAALIVALSYKPNKQGVGPLVEASGVEVGGPLVDKRVPGFTLPSVEHSSMKVFLSNYLGKPMVINFFASWCTPCQKELPQYAALARSEKGRVQFIGIDENDTRAAAVSMLNKDKVGYPAAFDGGGTLGGSFHLLGLPTTLFVNSKGIVTNEVAGQMSSSMLKSDIEKLISNP